MQKSDNTSRGSAFLMVMFMAMPMFVAVGLVVDVGWAYFTRQAAHAAAESAALGAAQAAVDGIKGGGTYTCGSKGLDCVSESCPTAIPNPTTSDLQNGCAYAIANGFTDGGLGGKQSVSIQANLTSGSVPNVPGIAHAKYWVSTRITQQNPLTFGAVLGGQFLNVGVRSTAAVIGTAPQNCITALNRTANPGLSVSGGAQLSADCGVAVDSNSSGALSVSNNSSLTADSIEITGGYTNGGTMTPNPPITGADPVADPYVNLPAPPASASDCASPNTKQISGGTVALSPGTYCGGISISGGASVTFSPGNYILLGGGLSVSGSGASLTGAGVMFYNTCNPSPCAGGSTSFSGISMTGNSTIDLSGPTSGLYAGMLFYEDRTVGGNQKDTVSGGSSVNLTGVLYFPNSELTYSGSSGGSTDYMVIVADRVKVTGGSTVVGSPFSPSSILSVTKAVLVE